MSLSSIIRERKDIRGGLRARVLKPSITFGPIRAAPLTTNYAIVGTAFDYLLRFFLQRANRGAQSRRWVAELGVEYIGVDPPDRLLMRHGLDQEERSPRRSRKRRKAEAFLNEAKRQHQAYLKTGVVTDELLLAVLRLAHLDVVVRAGEDRVDWAGLESPDAKDIADLRALLALVDKSSFRVNRVCLLNPTFGKASELVGGADADVVIDDCLIDIKTTKEPSLNSYYLFELVGYYLLWGLGSIGCQDLGTTRHEINSLAIYFSRSGYLWKVGVNEVLPLDSVRDTARWFFESVCTSKAQRLEYMRVLPGPFAAHLKA